MEKGKQVSLFHTARRVNSHSLGTDYNKLGHRTADLFGILKNSMFFLPLFAGNIKEFFLIKQNPDSGNAQLALDRVS